MALTVLTDMQTIIPQLKFITDQTQSEQLQLISCKTNGVTVFGNG